MKATNTSGSGFRREGRKKEAVRRGGKSVTERGQIMEVSRNLYMYKEGGGEGTMDAGAAAATTAGPEQADTDTNKHTTHMGINFLILLSKQGKVRLSKWYQAVGEKEKQQIVRDITAIIPLRRAKMCNVIEYKDTKIVYKRYASLFFITSIGNEDNELITLELIQRYVEIMDKAYGNVCELDIVFNFQLAYYILDELIIDGNIQESSSMEILRKLKTCDDIEEADLMAGTSSRKYIM